MRQPGFGLCSDLQDGGRLLPADAAAPAVYRQPMLLTASTMLSTPSRIR